MNQIYKRLKSYSQQELAPTVLQLSRQNLAEFVTPKTIVRPYSFSPRFVLLNEGGQTYAIDVSSLTFKNGDLHNSFNCKEISFNLPNDTLIFGYFETTIYGNEIFVVTKGNVTCTDELRVEKSYPVYQLRSLVTELIFNSIPISAIEFMVNGKSAFYPLALLAAHEIYDLKMQEENKVYGGEEELEENLVKLQITSSSTPEVFWVQDSNQNKLGLLYLPSTASLKFVKGLFNDNTLPNNPQFFCQKNLLSNSQVFNTKTEYSSAKNTRKVWCMCKKVELEGETRYIPIQQEDDSDDSSTSS